MDYCPGCQDAKRRIAELEAINSAPDVGEFMVSLEKEIRFQRQKWGTEHDAGKTDADWFWLIGYLAGKALTCAIRGEPEKALHHIITTAAACANWHAARTGKTNMRPGIAEP